MAATSAAQRCYSAPRHVRVLLAATLLLLTPLLLLHTASPLRQLPRPVSQPMKPPPADRQMVAGSRVLPADVASMAFPEEKRAEMAFPDVKRAEMAFSDEERAEMSTLGRVLLLGERRPPARSGNFTIAMWRHGKRIERRLLRSYTSRSLRAPLENCAVQNCRVVYTDQPEVALRADAVLVHLQQTRSPQSLPALRRPGQRWIFLSDESPRHTFLMSNNISHYNGLFNWSMGYRYDTDVPVPAGRTEPGRSPQLISLEKSKLAASMGSNCDGGGRWSLVKQLQQLLPVDVYGRCGTLKCAGHYDKDCTLLNDYKFYLSFENSHCDGYITEKVFWQAMGKGAVPVVWGARKKDYEKLLPPGSFIFAEDFATVDALATYLRHLNDTPAELAQYHAWRDNHTVLNEHGYFGSPVHYYCRICQALSYNSQEEKVYEHVDQFWGVKEHCVTPDKRALLSAWSAINSL